MQPFRPFKKNQVRKLSSVIQDSHLQRKSGNLNMSGKSGNSYKSQGIL